MPRKPKTKPPRTWDGLEDPDITGAEEAEAEQLIEFGRRSKKTKPPDTKEQPCPQKPSR
jgi:hypothetical protein